MSEQREINPEFHSAFRRVLEGIAHEWNRLIHVMERTAEATERLSGNAGSRETWSDTTDTLLDRIRKGDIFVDDSGRKMTAVMQFRDPSGNFVTCYYDILNTGQKEKIQELKLRDGHLSLQSKDSLLDIINGTEK